MKPPIHPIASTTVRALLMACGLLLGPAASGQGTYSPYSRFGLGQLHSGSGAAQMAVGQMGAAWADRSHLNTVNPAAPAFLTRTTFSGGFEVRSERIMEGDSITRGELGGLTQVAFAMKRAGGRTAFSFGLQPRSHSGYDVSQVLSDPVAEDYRIRYAGTGGLTQAHAGLSRRWEATGWRRFTDAAGAVTDSVRIISSGTAFGARFEQVFGGMVRTRSIDIFNPVFLDTRVQTEEEHRSAGFTVGLIREQLVSAAFDKDRKLVSSHLLRLGGVARLGRQHGIERSTRWASWQTLSSGPLEVDSVHATDESFSITLPLELMLGMEWETNTRSGARWRAGVEWRRTRWSTVDTDILDPGVGFADDQGLSLAMTMTPRGLDDARNAVERTTYSLGFRRQSGYIQLQQGLVESSVWSLGFSLPMLGSRSGSSLNTTFIRSAHSTSGVTDGLSEQGLGVLIGFTLHPFFKNQWLVPRKYD